MNRIFNSMNCIWLIICVAGLWISEVASATEPCLAWTTQSYFRARSDHAMVFDSNRNVAVIFGGVFINSRTSDGLFGETVEWDGSKWSLRSTDGPSPREDHAMVFDSRRNVVVLFGGLDSKNGALGDTWEWDGSTWTRRSFTGPFPRREHAMAYDSRRGVTVLHGGGGDTMGTTWEWDGNLWVLRSTSGPGYRYGHALAYDESRGVSVLFGGYGFTEKGISYLRETWEWDGTSWTEHTVKSPPPRNSHSMAYDSNKGVIVLHGGWDGNAMGDTWEWDGTEWTPREESGPSPRFDSAMAFNSNTNEVLLIAGQQTPRKLIGDAWSWNGFEWSEQYHARPPTRLGPMVFDSKRNVCVLVDSFSGTEFAEVWEWDGSSWSHRTNESEDAPIPIEFGIVFDSVRGVTVLHRGDRSSGLGETWEWDGKSWSLRDASGPPRRSGFRLACDSARGVIVMFGGTTNNLTGMDELWEWDGNEWREILVLNSPPPRIGHKFVYDSSRGVCVLYGGEHWKENVGRVYRRDIWEWNGVSWTDKTPLLGQPSPPTSGGAMMYDSAHGVVRLSNSGSTYIPESVWEWNGTSWTERENLDPSPPAFSPLAYDSARRTTVVLGIGETWELHATQPCSGDVDGDGRVNANDLILAISQWGLCGKGVCTADLTGDGIVNRHDLLLILDLWS